MKAAMLAFLSVGLIVSLNSIFYNKIQYILYIYDELKLVKIISH